MPGKHSMDLCQGPLFPQILRFSLPLFGTLLLQLLFNTADLIIVGHFASHQALAAVGSTSSLIHLLINMLVGMSIGTSVIAAQAFGANDTEKLSKTTHTSIALSAICGIIFGIGGFFASRPLLLWMSTPEDVIDYATMYMKIYFIGLPFLQIYNFGSAVLRSIGDTKRPLYYLIFSGILNVALNMYFVIILHMDVDGVAIATVISEAVSAILVCYALSHCGDTVNLTLKKLKISFSIFKQIIALGVPAGIQGCCFSFSNVILQSSVNTFGSLAVAGSSVAITMEGLVYTGSHCYHHTAISFVGQNYGAKKFDRINKSIWLCIVMGLLVSATAGLLCYGFGRQIIGFFNSNPDVIEAGITRMSIVMTTYGLLGLLDAISGAIRGLGRSVINTAIMLFGVVGIRLAWIFFAFPLHRTFTFLFLSYPLSWIFAALAMALYLYLILRHEENQLK